MNAQDASGAGAELPEARRLVTPTRAALQAHFAAAEAAARRWIAGEVLAALAGLVAWFALRGNLPPWQAALFFAAGFLGLFYLVLEGWLADRIALEKLPPERRFGQHTRDSLLALVRRVQERLGYGDRPVRAYLGRGKDVNALAQRLELLPGFGSWNGVQLDRAIVHLLDEQELESVVGHELGHVHAHAPLASRCLLVHALLSGAASLLGAELLPFEEARLMVPVVAVWGVSWIAFGTHRTRVRAVEFLCDDLGARAAGVLAAVRMELKLGLEQEAREALLLRVLEVKQRADDVPLARLMADYEAALPFGRLEAQAAHAELEKNLRARLVEQRRATWRNLLEYLWGGDQTDSDALAGLIQRLRAQQSLAKVELSVAELAARPGALTLASLGALARALEEAPRRVLFRLAHEVDDADETHPNPSRRVLYLWRQAALEPERPPAPGA